MGCERTRHSGCCNSSVKYTWWLSTSMSGTAGIRVCSAHCGFEHPDVLNFTSGAVDIQGLSRPLRGSFPMAMYAQAHFPNTTGASWSAFVLFVLSCACWHHFQGALHVHSGHHEAVAAQSFGYTSVVSTDEDFLFRHMHAAVLRHGAQCLREHASEVSRTGGTVWGAGPSKSPTLQAWASMLQRPLQSGSCSGRISHRCALSVT